MVGTTGLEPEVIRFTCCYTVLSGLFSMQLVPVVLPCVSVYRRLVIQGLSRSARKLALQRGLQLRGASPPQPLKTGRIAGCVSNRVLNIAMSQIILNQAGIRALIGQSKAA